jgi:GDP-L-fucose synthase
MNRKQKIFVAGHRGMVGSAIVRKLRETADIEIVTRSRADLNLLEQSDVRDFLASEKPDQVYLAAAKVGGIHANNSYPAEFIYENLMIQLNIINGSFLAGIKKLLFLGSSCIYPRDANQPMAEGALLTGVLEETNEPYAIAKIAGIKLCESFNRQYGALGFDFRSVMPTNLYGPGDNYHLENSHVIPALIRRFHEAKTQFSPKVTIWGSGEPRREFLHVDDMAGASVYVMNLSMADYRSATKPMLGHLNVGYGSDVSIYELAQLIAKVIDYQGEIDVDRTKPDGTHRKLMDSSLLKKMGWAATINLEDGLRHAYHDYLHSTDIRNN